MVIVLAAPAELVGRGGFEVRRGSDDEGGATVDLGTGGLVMVGGPDEHPPARATITTGAAKLARRR